MKKLIEKIDFLWKGDSFTLEIMWMSIFIAILSLIEVGCTIYSIVKK